jgi:hypothetical protein
MKTELISKLKASQIIGAAFPMATAPGIWRELESGRMWQCFVGESMLTRHSDNTWAISGDQDDIDHWMGFTFEPIVGANLN